MLKLSAVLECLHSNFLDIPSFLLTLMRSQIPSHISIITLLSITDVLQALYTSQYTHTSVKMWLLKCSILRTTKTRFGADVRSCKPEGVLRVRCTLKQWHVELLQDSGRPCAHLQMQILASKGFFWCNSSA
jgi:hypothetical protein